MTNGIRKMKPFVVMSIELVKQKDISKINAERGTDRKKKRECVCYFYTVIYSISQGKIQKRMAVIKKKSR